MKLTTYLGYTKNSLTIYTTPFHLLIFYYFKWLKYSKPNRSSLIDKKPWIIFEAFDFILSKLLKKNFKVFEFGSGGSTLFFAEKVTELISVEHNKEWYSEVQKIITLNNYNHVKLNLIQPEKLELEIVNPDYSSHHQFLSSDNLFLNKYSFYNYANYINNYKDEYFDMVFVDGRARPSCIFYSLPKIKIGGYLILDNSDRKYYTQKLQKELLSFEVIFEKFGPGPYGEEFWATTVYKKMYRNESDN